MLANGAVNLLSVLVLCAGGCRDEELIAPPSGVTASPARVLITSDSACAQVSFLITGTTTVQTTFPDRAACTSKLVVIKQEAAQWAQSPNRRLKLRVRILNRSGQVLQLPIRLYLPASGTTVLAPTGQPSSKVVAVEADSSEAGGGRIWFIGGSGTIAANDSTVNDTLMFNVQSPVTQARFQFQASAQVAGRPPIPSNSWPANPLLVASPADPGNIYYRNVVGVLFDDSTSTGTVAGIFSRYGAVVIGGSPPPSGTGEYYVQVPDPGSAIAAIDSVVARIQSESGVRRASRISYRLHMRIRGRYPHDGTFAARGDWFRNPAPVGTAPRLAVRAPLAWGCETGAYTSQRVRVGVLDATFDSQNADFDQTNLHTFPLSAASQLVDDTNFALGHSGNRGHGTGVAGILAAVGDNGIGVAGMVWSADLTLYNYGVGTQITNAPELRFEEVLRAAASSGTRVLTTSVAFGDAQDPALVGRFRDAMAFYLANPQSMLVIANGNDRVRVPLSEVANPTDTLITAIDRAAAELYTTYGNQIIFAAGSSGGVNLWDPSASQGSNVWIGATSLAAPADFILSLGIPSEAQAGFDPGTRVYSGTSFAAPFIAGAATELWSMDPSLTGAEVKDYLQRGALVPRRDPVSGTSSAPAPLQGASGVYQLDAYGSLSLLSRERAAVLPICGYDVRIQAGTLVLDRNGSNAVPYSVPSSMGSVSVAQGGRLIALGRYAYDASVTSAPGALVIDYLGHTIQTLPTISRRIYLERDIADLTYMQAQNPVWGSGQPRLTITGPGRTAQDSNIDVLGPVVSGSSFRADFVEVDPTGQFAATLSESFTGSGCTIDTKNTHLIPLHGGGATLVRSFAYDSCNPQVIDQDSNGDEMTFSTDGTRALFSAVFDDVNNGITGIRTRLYEYSLPGLTFLHGSTVQDYWVGSMRYDSDGLTILGAEADLNYIAGGSNPICRNTIRQDAPTFGAFVTSSLAGLSDCNLWGDLVIRPNLRALSAARFARKPPAWAH